MSLFGPSKIKVSPKAFVATQLDYVFSAEFQGQQRGQFDDIAKQTRLVQKVSPDLWVKEKQNATVNLLQIAWDRNTPQDIFVQYSSIIRDDLRVKAIDSGVYSRSLSKAQEARMSTFAYIAMTFLLQLLPQSDRNHPEFGVLLELCSKEFTGLYMTFEGLMKQYKFVP